MRLTLFSIVNKSREKPQIVTATIKQIEIANKTARDIFLAFYWYFFSSNLSENGFVFIEKRDFRQKVVLLSRNFDFLFER